jgi:hypothetical protein
MRLVILRSEAHSLRKPRFVILLAKFAATYMMRLWFSGKIGHCQLLLSCLAPGSIPGERIIFWSLRFESTRPFFFSFQS